MKLTWAVRWTTVPAFRMVVDFGRISAILFFAFVSRHLIAQSNAPIAPAPAPAAAPPGDKYDQASLKLPFSNIIQAYEPNEVGYTFDQGKESFMDFSVSVMLPFFVNDLYYPKYALPTGTPFWRAMRYKPYDAWWVPFFPYLAVNIRAGQYIFTRESAPVVNKRFNPLLVFRLWGADPGYAYSDRDGGLESLNSFIEFVYAHESNGQYINSPIGFQQQLLTYEQEHDSPTVAYHAARDDISRGWDYVGLQFAHDGYLETLPVILSVRAKFSYYLPDSPPQGKTEQYNFWENLPDGKPREQTDGFSIRVNLIPQFKKKALLPIDRVSLTGTTGYFQFLKYDTIEGEIGIKCGPLPLVFWYRRGYNGDQTDYFHKSQSYGVKFSYWRF